MKRTGGVTPAPQCCQRMGKEDRATSAAEPARTGVDFGSCITVSGQKLSCFAGEVAMSGCGDVSI